MLKTLVAIPIYIARRWGIHIIIVGATVFLMLLVQRRVYEYFSHNPRYSIDLDKYQIAAHPDWLIDDILKKSIDDSLCVNLKTSIFDDELLPKLARHYESSPWVSKVELLERRLPHDLKIKLELRKPFIAVLLPRRSGGSRYYIVDKEIVRLPGEYKKLPVMPVSLPVVVGVKDRPPLAGKKWEDKGLHNAITIARVLEEQNMIQSLHLARIDVNNVEGHHSSRESEIVLWTRNNIPIQWGRAPDTDKFGELTMEDKIKNLKLVLEVCPELKGIRYVKIQFDQPYIALER